MRVERYYTSKPALTCGPHRTGAACRAGWNVCTRSIVCTAKAWRRVSTIGWLWVHCSRSISNGTSAAIQDAGRASAIEQAAHLQASLRPEPAGSEAAAGGPVSSLLTPQVGPRIPSDTPPPSPGSTSSRHAAANLHSDGFTTACAADVRGGEERAGVVTLAT